MGRFAIHNLPTFILILVLRGEREGRDRGHQPVSYKGTFGSRGDHLFNTVLRFPLETLLRNPLLRQGLINRSTFHSLRLRSWSFPHSSSLLVPDSERVVEDPQYVTRSINRHGQRRKRFYFHLQKTKKKK